MVRNAITKRKKMEKDVNDWELVYLEENRIYLQERDTLITLIAENLVKFFDWEPENTDFFLVCVVAYNITRGLARIGYLENDYKPLLCSCNCGEYVCYTMHLSCSCINNNPTVFRYLNLSNTSSLKELYRLILLNKHKIKPLVEDVKKYLIIYERQALWMDFLASWNPKLKRMVLVESDLPKPDLKGLSTRDRLSEIHRLRSES